jgi:FAD/FMN-containing dehydrogenase
LEQEITPACILTPTSSEDVALSVKALVSRGVEFAVRGGGHTLNAGAANIQGGVTIDLRRLNKTTLNDDQSIASIGAGSVWADVYQTLDPLKLAVAGGRAGDVGVAGLTLGGAFLPAIAHRGCLLTGWYRRHLVVQRHARPGL